MPTIIPPVTPPTSEEHDRPHARIQFRVQQVFLGILTIGITCWLWRVHPIIGLTATFLAKHILVAILASGLSYPAGRPSS